LLKLKRKNNQQTENEVNSEWGQTNHFQITLTVSLREGGFIFSVNNFEV
jgi:hypothetical protein